MKELENIAKEIGSFVKKDSEKVEAEKPKEEYKEDPLIEKIKRYLLIGLTTLIVSGAVLLILRSILIKFLK